MKRQTGRQFQRRNGTTTVPQIRHAHLSKAVVPRNFNGTRISIYTFIRIFSFFSAVQVLIEVSCAKCDGESFFFSLFSFSPDLVVSKHVQN